MGHYVRDTIKPRYRNYRRQSDACQHTDPCINRVAIRKTTLIRHLRYEGPVASEVEKSAALSELGAAFSW